MKRLLSLVIAVLVLAGCRGQSPPAADPFLGRTRVAPPGTQQVSGVPIDPYYQGAPQFVSPPTQPRGTVAPRAMAPGTSYPLPPSSGIQYRGTSAPAIKIPRSARPELDSAPPTFATVRDFDGSATQSTSATQRIHTTEDRTPTLAASPAPTSALAGRERVIRILPPRTPSADTQRDRIGPVAGVSRPVHVPTRSIDIMDLPDATSRAVDSSGFRLVSGTERPNDGAVVRAVAESPGAAQRREPGPRTDYDYDSSYSRLRGRLEYSQADRRWKLRYIPVDGRTDDYGGSVILSDPTLLGGYERGDFVEVSGHMGRSDPKQGFSPSYEVSEVRRLK